MAAIVLSAFAIIVALSVDRGAERDVLDVSAGSHDAHREYEPRLLGSASRSSKSKGGGEREWRYVARVNVEVYEPVTDVSGWRVRISDPQAPAHFVEQGLVPAAMYSRKTFHCEIDFTELCTERYTEVDSNWDLVNPMTITLRAPGMASTRVELYGFGSENDATHTNTLEKTLHAHPGIAVRGRVLSHRGTPSEGVKISLFRWEEQGVDVSPSIVHAVWRSWNGDGHFVVAIEEPGRYALAFEHEDYVVHTEIVEVEASRAVQLEDVRLQPACRLRGTFLVAGRPSRWVTLSCTPVGQDGTPFLYSGLQWHEGRAVRGETWSSSTESDGAFTFSGRRPGRYRIDLATSDTFSGEGLDPSEVHWVVDLPKQSELNINLDAVLGTISWPSDEDDDFDYAEDCGGIDFEFRFGEYKSKRTDMYWDYSSIEVLLPPFQEVAVIAIYDDVGQTVTHTIQTGAPGSRVELALPTPPHTAQQVKMRLGGWKSQWVERASIYVRPASKSEDPDEWIPRWDLRADSQGWMWIRHIQPGTYELTIEPEYGADDEYLLRSRVVTKINVQAGEVARVERPDHVLQLGGRLELIAMSSDGVRFGGTAKLLDGDGHDIKASWPGSWRDGVRSRWFEHEIPFSKSHGEAREPIPPGNYILEVTTPFVLRKRVPVHIKVNETTAVTVRPE